MSLSRHWEIPWEIPRHFFPGLLLVSLCGLLIQFTHVLMLLYSALILFTLFMCENKMMMIMSHSVEEMELFLGQAVNKSLVVVDRIISHNLI